MMSTLRIFSFLLALLVVVVNTSVNAFAPNMQTAPRRTAFASKSALKFGFLKELGFEKPSWLPDFGGSKAKEEVPAPEESSEEQDSEEESVVEE